MKKLFCILLILVLPSCVMTGTGSKDTSLLDVTDDLYEDIKIVVTDPAVQPMFSPATMKRLKSLEEDYLIAKLILKDYPEDAEALQKLTYVSTEILGIIGGIQVERVQPYIAAIRISIQILQRRLPDGTL